MVGALPITTIAEMTSNPPHPASITISHFKELLKLYETTIARLSNAAKKSDESLDTLDKWYRTELPETLHSRPEQQNLFKTEVQRIVAYKLKRGKFRPSLMGFASALDEQAVTTTSAKAVKLLPDSVPTTDQIIASVKELSTLKGVGPATASYLLAAFRPKEVPIFSDEAFRWIFFESGSGKGWDRKIKYDIKEYNQFVSRIKEVSSRLGVDSAQVEMVGFVLGKGLIQGSEAGHGLGEMTKINSAEKRKILIDGQVVLPMGGNGNQAEKEVTKRKRAGDEPQYGTIFGSKKTLPTSNKIKTQVQHPTAETASNGRVTRSRTRQRQER